MGAALVAALAPSALGHDGVVGPIALGMTPAQVHARIGTSGTFSSGITKAGTRYAGEVYRSGPDVLKLEYSGTPLRLDLVDLYHDILKVAHSQFAGWLWQGSGLLAPPADVPHWHVVNRGAFSSYMNSARTVQANFDQFDGTHRFFSLTVLRNVR
ncbi:MAG TPA: hypothetical protein VFL13_13640 [Candidatus Baltobacteraceae bacterium]|nr:hypothetical protein [Candidatus Baltobacteraceae bacterium]